MFAALRSYEDRVAVYSDRLVQILLGKTGETQDLLKWFSYYAFAVMGDLAFGMSFGMLERKDRLFLELVHKGQAPVGAFTPLPGQR